MEKLKTFISKLLIYNLEINVFVFGFLQIDRKYKKDC